MLTPPPYDPNKNTGIYDYIDVTQNGDWLEISIKPDITRLHSLYIQDEYSYSSYSKEKKTGWNEKLFTLSAGHGRTFEYRQGCPCVAKIFSDTSFGMPKNLKAGVPFMSINDHPDYVAGHDERERLLRDAQLALEAEKRLEEEKQKIADRIRERERRRQLEKQVLQELIDKGEIMPAAGREPIPRDIVNAVYTRDGGRCVYCGSNKGLQIDHIIPFSKGGADSLENFQILCQKCNIEKSNKIG